MSTKPEVARCKHCSCTLVGHTARGAECPTGKDQRFTMDNPQTSPDWIAKAAEEAAEVIVTVAYELHGRPVIGGMKGMETDGVADIIRRAIERNAK